MTYVYVNSRPVARTVEVVPGMLLVDYDADGFVVGVEYLGD